MDRKAAKELHHIQGWLERVDEILVRGKDAYLGDALGEPTRVEGVTGCVVRDGLGADR